MNSFTRQKALVGMFAVIATAAGCNDTSAPVFEGPPPLPLNQSMIVETNLFDVVRAGAGANYNAASAVVAAGKAATTVVMPTSRTIFAGAEDTDPTEESDGYHWDFAVTSGSEIFDADLKGRARGLVDAVWEMRVTSSTSTPTLSNFLLLSGRSDLNEEKGEWKVFDSATPGTPTALLDVFWFKEGTNSWRVVFKNIKTGSVNIDDYLEYQSALDLRRVFYFDKSANVLAVVQWNLTTNEGYIISPAFNGGVRSCWNAQFANTVCLL